MSYIGSTPTTQSFIAGTDYFNGTGSQVAFTLSRSVNSVNDIEVIVNNVEQIPSGYSVSGTTLTFSAAPSAGTSNVYVRYLSTTNLSLAIPAGTSATFNTVTATAINTTNLAYTGTLTGNGGIINIGSGQVYKDASGNVGIGTSSPVSRLSIDATNSTAANNTLTGSWVNVGSSLFSGFGMRQKGNSAGISGIAYPFQMATIGGLPFEIYTTDAQPLVFGTNGAERARIDGGNFLVGLTSGRPNGGKFQVGFSGSAIVTYTTSTATQNSAYFETPNGIVGSISTTGSSTTFSTSSDYRLKEAIAPMTGALATVAALKPVTYKWKADGSDGQGFIAHELQAVVPDCVTGEKDAVDAEGNPQYQGIDTSFLVATLTAAIQEQQTLITALTARITALEAK